jgi:hypothetical protein
MNDPTAATASTSPDQNIERALLLVCLAASICAFGYSEARLAS